MSETVTGQLRSGLRELKLPTMLSLLDEATQQAAANSAHYHDFLMDLVEQELSVRSANRIARLLRQSALPADKTLEAFDRKRLKLPQRQQVKLLANGDFIDRHENVLAFGNPGSGKTHLLCGICHQLVRLGHPVLFAPAVNLIQQLLRARRDLELPRLLHRLDRFRVIFLDDIGYIQHSREEMEVLFNLLAHRYEKGSVMITSNLPFSQWDTIFRDPMTTAAAIDRLVHHSVILEMNLPSYRLKAAKQDKLEVVVDG